MLAREPLFLHKLSLANIREHSPFFRPLRFFPLGMCPCGEAGILGMAAATRDLDRCPLPGTCLLPPGMGQLGLKTMPPGWKWQQQ